VSLQLQEAFQTGDEHHGSIGEMFVTWWNWYNCIPRQFSAQPPMKSMPQSDLRFSQIN